MTRRGFLAIAAGARDETIAHIAARLLAGRDYVVLHGADVVAVSWASASTPMPLASLVKPFVAVAYGEVQGNRFPEFECRRCWLAGGHGRVGLREAIARSCNTYFRMLAGSMETAAIERAAYRYGLAFPRVVSPEILAGQQGEWRSAPVAVARAYAELAARRGSPAVDLVLDAMRACAQSGTAAAARASVAAKTGTAPCVHGAHGSGDGIVVAIARDRVALVRSHGITGSACARDAGAFLRAL